MGICAASPEKKLLGLGEEDVRNLRWRARERWRAERNYAANTTAELMLEPCKLHSLITKLYQTLGGTKDAETQVVLKGGAGFSVYMAQEIANHWDRLPLAMRSLPKASDLDFSSVLPPQESVRNGIEALPWLAEASAGMWTKWLRLCPQWSIRWDSSWGESYHEFPRSALGDQAETATEGASAQFPMKLTFHAGLGEAQTKQKFELLRIGAAIWHKEKRRATVAPFVDVALMRKQLPSVAVGEVRVQAPRSMLKTLRRLTFHETAYKPWEPAREDHDKHNRRLERLIKLSFLQDWIALRGPSRGLDAASRGVVKRWQKALNFLLLGKTQHLRRLAASSPPQLRFLLACLVRSSEEAHALESTDDFDCWLVFHLHPLVTELV